MSKIYKSVSELIGKTPLLELVKIEELYNLKSKIFAKLEFFNPAGSVKDRVALKMIEDAFKKGLINKDSTIIEPTSGNTGIGLAAIGASMGLKVVIVMPDDMSKERIKLIEAYGAKVILTDGKLGMKGSIEKANELKRDILNSYIPSQFDNFINPLAHYETTAEEIYQDLDGDIDILVCGVGSGGTITGVGRYLKEKNKNIRIVAVEPFDSPVLSKGVVGIHKIQGIGAGFVPKILDTNIYDEIITVTTDEAYQTCNLISKNMGILVGVSSGANIYVAIKLAKELENKDKKSVVILPDSGERYLSINLFEN